MSQDQRNLCLFFGVAAIIAVALKVFFDVSLALSAVLATGYLFIGLLIQFDDWFPGGWSNPDGDVQPPYLDLAAKFVVFLGALGWWIYTLSA